MKKREVPIWHKTNLTLEEAAAYSNIGLHKLREITDDEDCNFVLWIGNKRLIKREPFDKYLSNAYSLQLKLTCYNYGMSAFYLIKET